MKNSIKLFGIIAMVAVIGLSMAGCKQDVTDPIPQTVTYRGIDDNNQMYMLKITENTGRAAYTPQRGDSYELTVGTKKSRGTVVSYINLTITLQPSVAGATQITVTVSSSGITGMTGTITFTDGSPSETAPTTVTPSTGGSDPIAGTWEGVAPGSGNSTFNVKTIAANGSFKNYLNNAEYARGTYTFAGNTVTMTITEMDEGLAMGGASAGFKPYDDLPADFKQAVPKTSQITITGNTLTSGGVTFTKTS